MPKQPTEVEEVKDNKEMDPRDAKIAALDAKVNSLLSFIEGQNRKTEMPKREIKNTATVLFIKDKAVIKFGQAEEEVVDDEDKLMIPIVLRSKDGETEEQVVDWLSLLNRSPRYTCEIISQQAEKFVIPQEVVPRRHRIVVADPLAMRSSGTPFQAQEIMLEHTQVKYTSKIKFLDGPWKDEEIEIPNEAFNH